jgi:hypothetical protein
MMMLGTMMGTKPASTLTSFAVSSHNGVSAVEPDAADDRKLGICPVEPFIVIVHSQPWGERMLSVRDQLLSRQAGRREQS